MPVIGTISRVFGETCQGARLAVAYPQSTMRLMMRRSTFIGITALLMAGGCAGIQPVQVGQTAGAIAGGVIAPGVGAPLGALVGLVTGLLVQGEVDKVVERQERRELGQEMGARPAEASAEPPALPHGQPVRVWADETVRDGRLIPGHFDVRSVP